MALGYRVIEMIFWFFYAMLVIFDLFFLIQNLLGNQWWWGFLDQQNWSIKMKKKTPLWFFLCHYLIIYWKNVFSFSLSLSRSPAWLKSLLAASQEKILVLIAAWKQNLFWLHCPHDLIFYPFFTISILHFVSLRVAFLLNYLFMF